MARGINTEVSAIAETGGGSLPKVNSSALVPSNTFLAIQDPILDTAAIKGNLLSGERALQEIAKIQTSLNFTNIGLVLTDVTNQKNEAGNSYLKQNPDGRGYANFLLESYDRILDDKISNAPNREISNSLIQYKNSSREQMYNQAVTKEYETGRRYGLETFSETKSTLLNQLVSSPEDEPFLREQYAYALASTKPYLSSIEYRKFTEASWDEYSKILGEQMILANPEGALTRFKKGDFNSIASPQTLNHLVHTAINQIESNKNHYLRDLKILDKQKKLNDLDRAYTSYGKSVTGELTPLDINSSDLPQQTKNDLTNIAKQNLINSGTKADLQLKIIEDARNLKPTFQYSQSQIEDVYSNLVIHMEEEQRAPVPILKKAMYAISLKSNKPNRVLAADLTNFLQYGNADQAFEAAEAIDLIYKSGHNNLISNIDPKYITMASDIRTNSIISGSYPNKRKQVVDDARTNMQTTYTKEQEEGFLNTFKVYNTPKQIRMFLDEDLRDSTNITMHSVENKKALQNLNEDSQLLLQDAQRELRNSYKRSGDIEKAKRIMNENIRKYWGENPLNADSNYILFKNKAPLEREPPQKLHPELSEKWLKNDFFEAVEIAARQAESGGVIKRGEKLVKSYTSDTEKYNKDLTTMNYPKIKVSINGKWEDRQVYMQRDFQTNEAYSLYYWHNESEKDFKMPIKNTGNITNFRFTFSKPTKLD